MALLETAILTGTIIACLTLAYMIRERGAVQLIAGYEEGDLPKDAEQELTRDVKNLLTVTAAIMAVFIFEIWVEALPLAELIAFIVLFAYTAWIILKYRKY